MSNSPHDSCSIVELSNHIGGSCTQNQPVASKPSLQIEKEFENPRKSNSFNKELLRDRQAEPRHFVYVYDYSQNKTTLMKRSSLLQRQESEKIEQAPIPSKGSLAIRTGNDGFGGGQTIVARVKINMALRVQRWLGIQKQLYIVDRMQ